MKRFLAVSMLFAGSLAAADYSGIWNGKGALQSPKYSGGVPAPVQITLIQAGTSLTGTLKIGNGTPGKISSGSVSGNVLTIAGGGGGKIVTGRLTASGSTLSGSFTTSTGGTFIVNLSK